MSDGAQVLKLIQAASVFGLILSTWLIAVLLWAARRKGQEQKVKERLGLGKEAEGKQKVLRLWREGQVATTLVPRAEERQSLLEKVETYRRITGLKPPAGSLVLFFVGVCALAFALTFALTRSAVYGAAAALGLTVFAILTVNGRIRKYREAFEHQFVDALGLASRSLRAGHPLTGAFKLISEEMTPPVSDVFGGIWQQQAMGAKMEEAVREGAAMSGSSDMRILATAMIIQLRSGGNLADMMERLSEVVRDRLRLSRRAKVLTAQTQLSKRILIALPFVLFLGLYILNPYYLQPLYAEPTGRLILLAGGISMTVGVWMMNKIAVLEY